MIKTLEQQTAGVPGSAGARNAAINRLMSCEVGGETIRTKKANDGRRLCYSKGLLMLLPVPNKGRPPVSQVGLSFFYSSECYLTKNKNKNKNAHKKYHCELCQGVHTRRRERTCSATAAPECERAHQRARLGLCQMTVHPGRLSRKAAAQWALLIGSHCPL